MAVEFVGGPEQAKFMHRVRGFDPGQVLLVPVDGAYTLAQELMSGVIDQIRPHVVIPMHVFSPVTLERFVKQLENRYPLKRNDGPTVRFSRATLPEKQLLVLHGF